MNNNPGNTAFVARGFSETSHRPVGLCSGPKKSYNIHLAYRGVRLGAAAQPSGDKSPRHRFCAWLSGRGLFS